MPMSCLDVARGEKQVKSEEMHLTFKEKQRLKSKTKTKATITIMKKQWTLKKLWLRFVVVGGGYSIMKSGNK